MVFLALPHPSCLLQINVGTTVTMTGNGTRPPPTHGTEAPPTGPGQASTLAPSSATVDSTEGAPPPGPAPLPTPSHPRVIRISHQSVEPVVMMHMNIQGELGSAEESPPGGVGLVLRCGGGRGRAEGGVRGTRAGASVHVCVCVCLGQQDCLFLELVYIRKGAPPPCLDGGRGRQAFWVGNGGLKDTDLRRTQAGLGPACLRANSLCLPAQILAHSLVEFRVLPLAPWDPLVMARPWVRVRASEQAEL